MESLLVCFVSLALLIVSTVTMTMSTLHSAATLSDTWKAMELQTNVVRRTEIVSLPPANYYGGEIDLTVKNEGQTNISDFSHWDVIVAKQGTGASYMAYSPSYPPASGQWALEGIYISDNVPEVFDLNILNPGEQAVVGINPEVSINVGDTLEITIATSEGVTSQCYVTEEAQP